MSRVIACCLLVALATGCDPDYEVHQCASLGGDDVPAELLPQNRTPREEASEENAVRPTRCLSEYMFSEEELTRDYDDTLAAWREEVSASGCDREEVVNDIYSMVVGACPDANLRVLARSSPFGGTTLYYDDATGGFRAACDHSDVGEPACFGSRWWPEIVACDDMEITETICGTAPLGPIPTPWHEPLADYGDPIPGTEVAWEGSRTRFWLDSEVLLTVDFPACTGSAIYYGYLGEQGQAIVTGFEVDSGEDVLTVVVDDEGWPTQASLGSTVITVTYNPDATYNYDLAYRGDTLYGGTSLDLALPIITDADSAKTRTMPPELNYCIGLALYYSAWSAGTGTTRLEGYDPFDDRAIPLVTCLETKQPLVELAAMECTVFNHTVMPLAHLHYSCAQDATPPRYCSHIPEQVNLVNFRLGELMNSILFYVVDELWDDPACVAGDPAGSELHVSEFYLACEYDTECPTGRTCRYGFCVDD